MNISKGIFIGTLLGALAVPASGQEQQASIYSAILHPVNNSGVSGIATMAVSGNEVTVLMAVEGLETGVEHQQHLHGFPTDGETAMCPDLAADQDDDNLVSLEEAVTTAGPVVLPLTPFPSPTGETSTFVQTYQLDAEMQQGMQPLDEHVVVLHGLTVQGTFNPTLPVACGRIQPVQAAEMEAAPM